ncbi:CPBP family intramembrane glutamic endopeptidase [Cellulomonas triticagri]|uniref:CPBP family intramembrane glutamic endopeptidase n=1 Tax=Cellulomonas triticagri TaxID=2483352 RepID=UPI001315513B|nr:CPBP family intramembrane glutamic endopeptidase [Cellulomonas triticagri]
MDFVVAGLTLGVLVGFDEELTSRGPLLTALRGRTRKVAVALISSALFGLMHGIDVVLGQSVTDTLPTRPHVRPTTPRMTRSGRSRPVPIITADARSDRCADVSWHLCGSCRSYSRCAVSWATCRSGHRPTAGENCSGPPAAPAGARWAAEFPEVVRPPC